MLEEEKRAEKIQDVIFQTKKINALSLSGIETIEYLVIILLVTELFSRKKKKKNSINIYNNCYLR